MDAMDFGFDEEDDLSSALGTETLAARDIIPEGFDNTPRARGVLELTQLGRCHTTRPYTGRPGLPGRELRPGPGRPAGLLGSLVFILGSFVDKGKLPDFRNRDSAGDS